MKTSSTSVWLTDEQQALFVLFMKHYDNIGFMIQHGVFDTKRGSVTLNFTPEGIINSIEKRVVEYRPVDNSIVIQKIVL